MKKPLCPLTIIFLLAAGCSSAATQTFNNSAPAANNTNTASTLTAAKSCPPGFVKVPGSTVYHTPDFCIMKYEAKAALISNPAVGLEPKLGDPCSGQSNGHAYGTYKNNGVGCATTAKNNKQVVSTASGFPIAYIPETANGSDNVKSYCQQMGWHLITNPEWMTIARNVEQVAANWCNADGTSCGAMPGTLGKILANGHNNAQPAAALVASANDSQACFGTATDGSNTCDGTNSQKRTLTLSNGEVLWDFAGNVWQWVDGSVLRKDEPQSKSNGKLDIGWLSSEFAPGPGALLSVITGNGQGPSLGYDSFRPSNPAWNSNNGVGRIFHYSSASETNTTVYGFIRGGQWDHGAVDGAFSMHLTPVPDKTNIDDVGFRCAAPLQ
ncbi:MAG: hypothetical protein P4L74_04470 [Candidatus Doudnabacteria bacterium]|nr:hypothetical protein [Candidatus Doudnabacteria bacterium]